MEAILLRWDADNNACIAAQLSVKNSRRFDALNQVAVAIVRSVAPTGAIVQERLRALLAWVMEVTNYGIHQGVVGALATTQLRCGAYVGWSWGSHHGRPVAIKRTSSSTFSLRSRPCRP